MKPIIVVENVSKKYSRNANAHLSYGISDLWRELWGGKPSLKLRKDEFLAVNDVSFYLYPGDTFALIGRNGSGKTTLLKMMNGLVKPDSGTIIMDGRIQALISLGTGFNPNLSGRENIYTSAALMGLTKKETNAIIEEILDFAELDNFIDSPVGTYSSGMKARLGFAVAVHLKPDILLIDEILAVGDWAFQNKCFARMQELKKSGVTIVLVSHSHTSVMQLCEKAMWIHEGRMMEVGESKEVIQKYLKFMESGEQEKLKRQKQIEEKKREEKAREAAKPASAMSREAREGLYGPMYDDLDKIDELHFSLTVGGKETDAVEIHEEVKIRYGFRLKDEVRDLNVSLVLCRKDGEKVTAISTLNGDLLKHIHQGRVDCEVTISDFNVTPGAYVFVMPVHEGKSYLYRNVMAEFMVVGNKRMTWHQIDFNYQYDVRHEPAVESAASV